MATVVDRDEVWRLAERGARLLEVLPAEAYERLHLPQASSFPLAELAKRAVAELPRDATLVVYCYDGQ
jgi:rhodanese-related sulfurtransferase